MTAPGPPGFQRLQRLRGLASAILSAEAAVPLFWPVAELVMLALALALTGLPQALPPFWHAMLLAGCLGGIAALIRRGTARMARPTPWQVDRRLEQAGRLPHQPLLALEDQPASQDGGADRVWDAHTEWAAAQTARLRLPWPHLRPLRHPARYALAPVLLCAAALTAGPGGAARLRAALLPVSAAKPSGAPGLQAWISPPAYTDLPPVYLAMRNADAVSVPVHSRLTMTATGKAAPALLLDGHLQPVSALDADDWQAEITLDRDSTVRVRSPAWFGGTLAGWTVHAIPDQPPSVAWNGTPGLHPGAPPDQALRLPWRAADDYGVVSLQVALHLQDRPAAPAVLVPLPLPGHPKSAEGTAAPDLTGQAWAGLPVVARLIARDGAGQEAGSASAAFTLPERPFQNHLAQMLIAIRKALSLHPEQHALAAQSLRIIAGTPGLFDNNAGVAVALGAASSLLMQHDPAAVAGAQALLWQLALGLDNNGASRALQRVAEAEARVRDALAGLRDAPPEARDARQAELQRQIEALRQAIAHATRALAEQARQAGAENADPMMAEITGQDLDRLAQSAGNAARSGDLPGAEQQLAQLGQMLNALRQAKPMQRQAGHNGAQQSVMQDLVTREQALLSHAETPAGQTTEQHQQDARTQSALRRALGEVMQILADRTRKIPAPLGEADQAMRDAATALGAEKMTDAAEAERRAIAALQNGAEAMRTQAGPQFGLQSGPGQPDPGGDQPGPDIGQGAEPPGPRDPLGRRTSDAISGSEESDTILPDGGEAARSRAIQQELRRRAGQLTRPQDELDYIRRLLKPF